jgi:predicted ATP-dependent serine protease
MGEIKLPLEKESPVFKFYAGNDEKSIELKSKLDSLEIKINEEYEKPKVAWEYRSNDSEKFKPIGTIDNFSLVIGKAKAKKSFFIGIAVSTALSENVLHSRFKSNLSQDKNEVLYFDTEQSSYHVHLALKRICSQLNLQEPNNLHTYGLRKSSPKERLELIEYAIYNNPKVGFVVIDGIKDLINSINDEVEASMMANKLLRWTEDNHIHIVTVLHQNKGDNNARGHIGTELINKAETVLTVSVESTNENISIVEPQQCRNIPFDTFAFKINESGIPELVDDFIKSSSKKDSFDIFKTDDETKMKLLEKAFYGSNYLKATDLKIEIKSAYKTLYRKNFGDNKIKAFIPHCLEIGLLSQVKLRDPYFLSSSL